MIRPNGRDAGRRSIRLRRGFGTLVLAGVLAGPAVADSSCQLKEIANLPARFNGVVVIDVSINGVPAKFSLATGSSMTRISRSFATRLGLAIHSGFNNDTLASNSQGFSVNTGHGTYRPDDVRVSEIKIGDIVANYGHLIVMEEGGDGSTDQIAGSLGLDYLNKIDIELDPVEKRVHLFRQIDCPDRSVYWSAEHFEVPVNVPSQLPVVPVVVDGKEFRAYLVTNAPHSSIDLGAAKASLGLPDGFDSPPPSHVPDSGGPVQEPSYVFKEFVFGPITVRNPKLDIVRYAAVDTHGASHIKTSMATDAPVVVGMDILGKFHSMISLGNGKIYFTLPNERTPPAGAVAKQ